MDVEFEYVEVRATCHTTGCPNEDAAVVTTIAEIPGVEPTIICGPCGRPITDIAGAP